MRRIVSAALALVCWQTGAQGQEAEESPGPDLDFLEYLGTWAEEDDEWLAIEEWENGTPAKPEEDPRGSEREKEDEDESE